MIVGSLLAPRLARAFRPPLVVGAGLLVAACGFLILTQISTNTGPGLLVAGAIVTSLGLGPMMTLSTDLVIGAAPPDRVGAASALSTTAPQFGGALGIAILGTVGAIVYRASLTLPTLPDDTARSARETLGNAIAAAGRLSDPLAEATTAAARTAFSQGFQVIAAVCAGVLVLTTAVMTALLRHR